MQIATNTILQRYNFYSAYRKKEQSIGDFVAELKNLARNCDFGQTKAGAQLTAQLILEENLRDRLVCGVADSAIQRRLLGEADLDFKTKRLYKWHLPWNQLLLTLLS